MNSEQRCGWAGVSSQPDVAALTWSQEAELFLHQISLCSWALSCKCFPSLTFLPLHFAFFPLRPHPGIFGGLLVLPSALQHWVWESRGGSSPPLPAIAIAKENRTARLPAPLAFCPFSWQQMKARTHWKEQGWACWLAGVRHPDLSCCPAARAPSCGVGMELLSSATQPSEREDWEQKCWEAQQRIQAAMSQSQKIIQGLWSPLSISSQSARPHFLLRERWLPLGLAISVLFPAFRALGHYRVSRSQGNGNPFLRWKCWAGPNPRAVPEGLPGAGWPQQGSVVGEWVGKRGWEKLACFLTCSQNFQATGCSEGCLLRTALRSAKAVGTKLDEHRLGIC